MFPNFLLPESVSREDGVGPAMDLGPVHGKVISLTLGITRIIEQESLDVAIWGSSDGNDWGSKPLVSFPQKFYCGTYTVLLDLAANPEIRYLRAQWKMNRWGRGELKPMFDFYVFAELMEQPVLAARSA
jgi:hypothetical protein